MAGAGELVAGVEFFGGVEGEEGVSEGFAGHEDEVGFLVSDDAGGLLGFGDHADGGGHDSRVAFDGIGEGDLEAGGEGDFDVGDDVAGGAVDEVDRFFFEAFGEGDGIFEGPAAFVVGPVGAGEADGEWSGFVPDFADFADGFEEEADAVFEGAAVVVRAVVGEWGEEFVDEVSVGGVEFDELVAGVDGAFG